jgi:hypothetical protein
MSHFLRGGRRDFPLHNANHTFTTGTHTPAVRFQGDVLPLKKQKEILCLFPFQGFSQGQNLYANHRPPKK